MRKFIKLEVTEMELSMVITALEESFNQSGIELYNQLATILDKIDKDNNNG